MFTRYFLALCVIALFAAINTHAEEVEVDDDEVAERGLASKIITKIIGSLFTGAAANCLVEAGGKCKSHWKHPKEALSCAKDFLKENKGRCVLGK